MKTSNCISSLFYDMAAAMRNLNGKTVSKSVKYFSRYDFF